MSTTPSRPSLPPTKPDQFWSGTPGQDHRVVCDTPGSTLSDCGPFTFKEQEGDTDSVDGCKSDDYNVYDDLNSRVFVDFEVFLVSALNAPRNWRTLWRRTIKGVKADQEFSTHHREYCRRCEEYGLLEQSFSDALRKTANTGADVVSKFCGTSGNRLHPADDLQILEGKPYDGVLCNGERIPRLIVDGVDPISNHAPPYDSVQSQSRDPTFPTSSTTRPEPTWSRKRRCEGSPEGSQRAPKKPRTKPVLFRLDEEVGFRAVEESERSSASTVESETQSDPRGIQVCSYLSEMFSEHLLRSYATICLVDRDRLQLYHANCSVILVSSAINLFKGDGLDQFVAVIIALHCLSLKEDGTLDTFAMDSIKRVKSPSVSSENKVVRNQNRLELTEDGSGKKLIVTLGDVISRDPAIVGRSTLVLRAKSDQWPNANLVVKVSWPNIGWGAEGEFLEKAIEEAEKTEGRWATKHLPQVFWAKDIVFGKGSIMESVANLFKDAKFEGGGYAYERRVLRIIIQEELYPLKSLTSVRDIGQVFVDIACIHRWLYDHPGILHCDVSLNNIMYRIIEEVNTQGERERRVYGVLTDYDLSSWTKGLKNDTKTSQYHTGTLPYMAQELLKGRSAAHLYRHDLESLFYTILLTCARYTLGSVQDEAARGPLRPFNTREGKRPYQGWFDEQEHATLGSLKSGFFMPPKPIGLSPCFEDFRLWLRPIRSAFTKGFSCKVRNVEDLREQQELGGSDDQIAPFDDETLGGCVRYPSFIEPVCRLRGELEGLVIRYDPKTIPTPGSS